MLQTRPVIKYSQCICCCYDINSVPSLKQLGETWMSGCQQCVCDNDTLSVQCQPQVCPAQEPVNCTKEGEVVVNRTVDCCERLTCGECIQSTTPTSADIMFWHSQVWPFFTVLHTFTEPLRFVVSCIIIVFLLCFLKQKLKCTQLPVYRVHLLKTNAVCPDHFQLQFSLYCLI